MESKALRVPRGRHLLVTRRFWLETVSSVWKRFMDVNWEFRSALRAVSNGHSRAPSLHGNAAWRHVSTEARPAIAALTRTAGFITGHRGSGCRDVLVPFTALNAARLRQSSRGPGAAARSRQAPTPSPGPSPPPASADLVNQACPQGTGPRARRGEQEGNPLVRVPRRFSAPPIIWHAESLRPVIQLSTAL